MDLDDPQLSNFRLAHKIVSGLCLYIYTLFIIQSFGTFFLIVDLQFSIKENIYIKIFMNINQSK